MTRPYRSRKQSFNQFLPSARVEQTCHCSKRPGQDTCGDPSIIPKSAKEQMTEPTSFGASSYAVPTAQIIQQEPLDLSARKNPKCTVATIGIQRVGGSEASDNSGDKVSRDDFCTFVIARTMNRLVKDFERPCLFDYRLLFVEADTRVDYKERVAGDFLGATVASRCIDPTTMVESFSIRIGRSFAAGCKPWSIEKRGGPAGLQSDDF